MKKRILYMFILFITFVHPAFSIEEGRLLNDGFKEITDRGIIFQWKVVGDYLKIRLSAPTEGWVAVGFNPSNMMKDADYKLAYVEDGQTFIEDHYGSGYISHKEDTNLGGTGDFELDGGSEENGVTSVGFTIPLNSGDAYDKILKEGDEVKVLLAYSGRDSFRRKHKERTSVVIRL